MYTQILYITSFDPSSLHKISSAVHEVSGEPFRFNFIVNGGGLGRFGEKVDLFCCPAI